MVDASLNDKCNDAYGLVYASSMFVSPLIGSYISNKVHASKTCDIIAYANLAFAVVLFLFNCGPFVFQENRIFQAKLAELLPKEEEDGDLNKQPTLLKKKTTSRYHYIQSDGL